MLGELRPVDGGSPILLDKPSLTFGNDRTCDVVIEHPSVSANHCHMEFRDGHWFIEDLGSRGGIGVNGESVESAWVPALSVIKIGNIEFDLRYSSTHSTIEDHAANSPELLSKLERVLQSVQHQPTRRIQVRVDQAASIEPRNAPLGLLKPMGGGAPIALLYDQLYLGRDADVDVVLPYMAVAKTHCVLRFEAGFWRVQDLNNNGVSINGETVQDGRLLPGAVLGIATHLFEVSYVAAANLPTPEMPEPSDEYEVSVEDSSVNNIEETHASESESESEEVEVDESAVIDNNIECADDASFVDINNDWGDDNDQPPAAAAPACQPLPLPVDEPLLAVDDMLRSIELMLPPIEEQSAPVTELNAVKSTEIKSTEVKPSIAQPSKRANKVPPPHQSPANRRETTNPATAASTPQLDSSPSKPLIVTKQQVSVARQKRDCIVQFLKERKLGGLLLSRSASIAWYTGGADVPRDMFGQTATAVLITPEGETLLARKADGDLLLSQVTADQALQHRECAWPRDAGELLTEWTGTKKLACDQMLQSCFNVSSEVAAMRLALRPQEIEDLRKLGIRVARAVEKTAREFRRGDTEAQIAGDLASRMIRHEVVPEQIQVWGDGRGQNCQNWKYGRDPVEDACTIAVVARRHGLHVAVSRTVSFGIPSKELRWTFPDMLLAHATALIGSRDQKELSKVWAQVERVCETLGEAPAWRATDPGCVTGYQLCEIPIVAKSAMRLRAGMPVIWRSLIGPARAIDTVLVREADSKVITQTGEWPQIGITVNNEQSFVQTVLQRT
ncbi:MAG: FHA domain-containing protein [Planctomycetaceae bacterium]